YTESAQDAKLFETVFSTYTAEYLKGPMYETPEKMIGRRPFNPGEPLWGEDKKLTSNVLGPLKRVSSNELAFLTMICLAIGAWGEAQFLWFDPQFAAIDRGEYFNPIYIIAASLLPVSFWAHIACYIQKANGK
uniref:Photosystem I PsaR n=1 Tax=Amphidinium carterae TaxID=2961 RepID=UPI002FE4FB09